MRRGSGSAFLSMHLLPDTTPPATPQLDSARIGIGSISASRPMKRRFLYFFLGLCVAILSSAGAWGDVVISEFLANNNTGLVDEDGQRSDWIELYNNGTTAENLAGWHLTDD